MSEELTATDHINKKMLSIFKSHIENGNVKLMEDKENSNGVDPSEWEDEKDYRNDLPNVEGTIISCDPEENKNENSN